MMIDKYICRAKCIDNGAWVYGYPARLDYMSNEFSFIGSECIIHHIDQDTICKCTGLVDKYGNSIFEHDYVRTIFGRICEVVWFSSPRHCGWDLTPVANLNCSAPAEKSMWSSEWLTVLGNKFDNPELMENRK